MASQLIYPSAPTEEFQNMDNIASRLLQTIQSASPGILREAVQELNSTTPDVETYRQQIIQNLRVTSSTPINERKMSSLLKIFMENVPRSTLESSGLLPVVPLVMVNVRDLQSEINENQLSSLISSLESLLVSLASNFRNMETLVNLPRTFINLHDDLAKYRESLLNEGQQLMQLNATHAGVISELISSVDAIIYSVPVILQSIQNTIANTRLKMETYATNVTDDIEGQMQKLVDYIPELIKEITKQLDAISDTISKDMADALNYTESALSQSIVTVERLKGVAGNTMNLLTGRIQSSLSAFQRSVSPTVELIVAQLKALAMVSQAEISRASSLSSKNLSHSFEGVLEIIRHHLNLGASASKLCVDAPRKIIDQITGNAINGMLNCSVVLVEDTKKFINDKLDGTDDLLLDISELADQLDACSRDFNVTGGEISSFKLNSCLQAVVSNIQKSETLNHLSNIQQTIENKINSVHSTIRTCVNMALSDADNSALSLKTNVDRCFRIV